MLSDTGEWRWPLVILGAVLAGIIWIGAVQVAGDDAILVPVGTIGAAAAGWLFWQAVLRKHWALLTLMVVGPTILSMTFRGRAVGDPGLDAQTGAKVIVWFAMGAICLFNITHLRRFLADRVVVAFGCYCLIIMLSAVYSPVPMLTGVTAMSMTVYLGFALLLVSEFSERTLIVVLLWAFALACLVHVAAGILIPDVAYLQNDLDPIIRMYQPPVPVRLQGLTGQPNNLGRYGSVFALLVFTAAYRGYLRPILWVPNAVLAVGVTWATRSRGSLLALALGLILLIPRRFYPLFVAILISCGVLILVSGQFDTILRMISRDGTADEAVDMAGRTELWDFVYGLIAQRPILGYGFNSFESYAGAVLWTGPVADGVASHNNYLSVLYSNGIIGMFPFAVGFLILLYRAIVQPDPPRDFFVINVLIAGFAEIDVMSAFTFVPSFIFFIYVASDAWKRIGPNGVLSNGESPRRAISARKA